MMPDTRQAEGGVVAPDPGHEPPEAPERPAADEAFTGAYDQLWDD